MNYIKLNKQTIKNESVVEKKHGIILLTSSLLFGLNSIYGYYNYSKFNEIIFTNTILFLTSINYWRNPRYGLRRNIDITVAVINFCYNHTVISHCCNSWVYYMAMSGIVGFYCLSNLYHNINSNLSCLFHVMVHISANVGNFAVFSGLINTNILSISTSSIY
jgi:hypothetical protein